MSCPSTKPRQWAPVTVIHTSFAWKTILTTLKSKSHVNNNWCNGMKNNRTLSRMHIYILAQFSYNPASERKLHPNALFHIYSKVLWPSCVCCFASCSSAKQIDFWMQSLWFVHWSNFMKTNASDLFLNINTAPRAFPVFAFCLCDWGRMSHPHLLQLYYSKIRKASAASVFVILKGGNWATVRMHACMRAF